jgi:DNA mismatch endonuclease (patch repair protein)
MPTERKRRNKPPISRSENMRRIRSKNTTPELIVRRRLRLLGYKGYDIAFIGMRKAIQIHGCFWHGHSCKEGLRTPKSNREFWVSKISGNRARDTTAQQELLDRGWSVLTVWECELKDPHLLDLQLRAFISSTSG